MAIDDKRASSATTNDIEIAERTGIIQQGPQVFSGLSIFTASDHNSVHIVATFLGHDHEQHAVGNVAEAQYRVSHITLCASIEKCKYLFFFTYLRRLGFSNIRRAIESLKIKVKNKPII